MKIIGLIFGVTATLALAACSGGGGSSSYSGSGTGAGSVICPDIASVPPALVYPANGATGIPDTFGSLLFTGNVISISLVPAGGSTIQLGGVTATNPPSVDESVAVPTLAPHTTYQVVALVSGCPSNSNVTMGSFTTQ